MLFTPASHEPLAERGWDETWVRRRAEAIADDAEAAVEDGLSREHPLDHEPGQIAQLGIYLGAVGTVWALHRLGRDRPELARGLHAQYLVKPDWPGDEGFTATP